MLAALCAMLATGCSDQPRQSLTGPTPVTDASLSITTISGDRTTVARPASAGEVAAWAMSHGWAAAADGIVVEATEAVTAVSGTCPATTITVRGVPVALTSGTTFTAPMTCESIAEGTTVRITALLTYTSTGYTVTATNVATASDDGSTGGGGKKARGEGVIGAITGSCPTLTLIITGTRVSTTATTEYVNGSCETLRPGTKVTIDGELNPGGTATAEKIEIQRVPGRPVSGDGRVDSVAGTCPTLTLTARGVTVVTSSTTTFTGGTCADVSAGSHIDVTGDYDGTEVTATAVHIRKP